jgi:hypothetical protein
MKIRTLQPKISNKLVNITPLELFKMQVRNSYDSLRYSARGMSYTPNQFGGHAGQRIILSEPAVMEIIEFEVT